LAPIDVVVWTNEEAVRFTPPLTGSRVYAGLLELATAHAARTTDGTTVLEDLKSTGYFGPEIPGERSFDCFLEAHIEQGPVLEANARTVGVVTSIVGIRWSIVQLNGQDSHAGTTPMNRRRDALVGAAEIITALNRLACDADESARLTVGKMEVSPNSGATIPGMTTFVVDLRHPNPVVLNELHQHARTLIAEIAARHRLEFTIEAALDIAPRPFASEIVNIVRQQAERLGYLHMDLASGAGHDAMNLAQVVPTGMIFVPCKDGLSHNEAESATPEDLAAGAHTLMHAILARAKVV
jgi:beta-ureidopropionase / N-carbamoyl-L-amino-acid hydrolase